MRQSGKSNLHDQMVEMKHLAQLSDILETAFGAAPSEALPDYLLEKILAVGRDRSTFIVDEVSPTQIVAVAVDHRFVAISPCRIVVVGDQKFPVIGKRSISRIMTGRANRVFPISSIASNNRHRSDRICEPAVADLSGQFDRAALLCRHPYRWCRLLNRFRIEWQIPRLKVFPAEGNALLSPQTAN